MLEFCFEQVLPLRSQRAAHKRSQVSRSADALETAYFESLTRCTTDPCRDRRQKSLPHRRLCTISLSRISRGISPTYINCATCVARTSIHSCWASEGQGCSAQVGSDRLALLRLAPSARSACFAQIVSSLLDPALLGSTRMGSGSLGLSRPTWLFSARVGRALLGLLG
jgi:hypothetical protein